MRRGGTDGKCGPRQTVRRFLIVSIAIGSILSPEMAAARDGWSSTDLPPVPREEKTIGDMTLYLELVVNHQSTGVIVPVTISGGRHSVMAGDLRRVHIPADGEDHTLVTVDFLERVHVDYDPAALRLMIDVPPEWLPNQKIGGDRFHNYEPARSSPGALLNYDVYAQDSDLAGSGLSLWNEWRVFGGFGVASTTGIYRHFSGRFPGEGYRRYDTSWRLSDEQRMVTYEMGDLITRSVSWGSTVRLGGAQISRDFAVRPDVITYPLPQFSGSAAMPSAVDLFINGYRSDGGNVEPGPFTLTSMPYVNGAGEAVVVVTDALGRRVSTTIPFYISNELLREGLSDYAAAAGAIRQDYGLKDFSYGEGAASGSFRHGVTDNVTFDLHGEAGDRFGLSGFGGAIRLGDAGVVNASWSHSRYEGRADDQWSVGYQYSMRRFSVAAQHTKRGGDFADLSVYGNKGRGWGGTSSTVTFSASLDRFGSLGAGYFDVRPQGGERARLANLSWSLPLWDRASLYASGNRDLGDGGWSATLRISVPLGGGYGTASGGVDRDRDGFSSRRANYSRIPPSDGGLGWNVGYAEGSRMDRYVQADLNWRGDAAEARGGVYGSSGAYTRWADANGSVVLMDRSVFAANRINDAFVLVSTDGQKGVPVRYENQLVGRTDADGYVLVPWSSSYYRAKYTIDPLELPADAEVPVVEQRIAVRRGSGYRLDFPVTHIVAATVRLHDPEGRPLPVGATVTVNGVGGAYVGWDGIVYLERLLPHNRLTVRLPDGSACAASFDLDAVPDQIARIGPLTCEEGQEP